MGIARREILEKLISDRINSILVLDNVEYCANWGRLDGDSAKPELIKVYRSFLRSNDWKAYIFEQPEGRLGHGSPDKTGWESPHRWMSAVAWPANHLMQEFMVTNLGFPVVNEIGRQDHDVQSVVQRCPYDWNQMKWAIDPFPPELDLKLDRDFG